MKLLVSSPEKLTKVTDSVILKVAESVTERYFESYPKFVFLPKSLANIFWCEDEKMLKKSLLKFALKFYLNFRSLKLQVKVHLGSIIQCGLSMTILD